MTENSEVELLGSILMSSQSFLMCETQGLLLPTFGHKTALFIYSSGKPISALVAVFHEPISVILCFLTQLSLVLTNRQD